MEKFMQNTNTEAPKVFEPMPSNVKNTTWTFRKIMDEYLSTVLSDKPKYQRPDVYGFIDKGTGTKWQRELIAALLSGKPIPEVHFRFVRTPNGLEWTKDVYEIVDGGHRIRTVVNFLQDKIKTPIDFTMTDANGHLYHDIGNKHFSDIKTKYPAIAEYFYNLSLKVVEHYNLSDIEAERLFLTLNDLNEMSPADKRNAIDNVIADTNRKFGAVDSTDALPMFTSRKPVLKGFKAEYTDLSAVSRQTDEMVSWAMYYLYSGGIENLEPENRKVTSTEVFFKGMDSQIVLDKMYRDKDFIKRLNSPDDNFIKEFKTFLSIINDIVTTPPYRLAAFKKGGKWFAGPLKKLIMLVAETHRVGDSFKFNGKYKLDTKEFLTQLDRATSELKNDKKVLQHRPYQKYDIVSNKLIVSAKQPENVGDAIYPFYEVFKGGARPDDLLYIYQLYFIKGYLKFGKITLDTRREFSEEIAETLLSEQKNHCRLCNKLLTDGKYHIDHILPHSYGGPSTLTNSQALCTDCNGQKSNGMTFADVKYLCKRSANIPPQLRDSIIQVVSESIADGGDRLDRSMISMVASTMGKYL
jgi:hypothetical protein